jgi:hypothetical protein
MIHGQPNLKILDVVLRTAGFIYEYYSHVSRRLVILHSRITPVWTVDIKFIAETPGRRIVVDT